MKQFRFKKAVSFLLAIAITGATAISSSTVIAPLAPITAQAASKASITLNMKKTTMYVGESDTLSVKKVKGLKSKAVTFKSSKSSVVAVNSKGKISAKKAGTAKITVASKSNKAIKAICTITVRKALKIKKLLVESEVGNRLDLLQESQLIVKSVTTASSNNVTTNVTYKSSKPNIVSVNENGVIKGLDQGTAKITVTSVINPKVKTVIDIDVKSGDGNVELTYEDFDVSYFEDGGIKYNGKIYDNFLDYWNNEDQKYNYYVTYNENDTDADYKTFKTDRGIKLGDSLEDVMKAYNNVAWFYMKDNYSGGNTEEHKCTHCIKFLMDGGNQRINFGLDQNDKVMIITYGK